MAINCTPPPGVSTAQQGKAATNVAANPKATTQAPGAPAYPPDRLPAQPRSGGPQSPPPAAAANPRAPTAQTANPPSPDPDGPPDPRTEVPDGGAPLMRAAQSPGVARSAPAALPARTRPKTAATDRPLSDPCAPLQVPALATSAVLDDSAPVIKMADAAGLAPASAGLAPGTAALMRQFGTDPPDNEMPVPSPPQASSEASARTADTAGVTVTTPGKPAELFPSAAGLEPAMKFPIVQVPETSVDPQQRSAGVATAGDDATLAPGAPGPDLAPSQPASTAPAAATPPPIQTTVGASSWADEIGTHVVWMAHQGVSSASLRLQPEHLGPLEVKISLHDTTASVWFGANEPETRAALRAALPQLKEMFAAQGMTLTDAGVSREPPREAPHVPPASAETSGPRTKVEDSASTSLTGSRRGLVDTYA